MATWRTKGYVSDSEDENEDFDLILCHNVDQNDPVESIGQGESVASATSLQPLRSSIPVTDRTPTFTKSSPTKGSQVPLSASGEALQRTLSEGFTIVRDVLSQSPASVKIADPSVEAESPLSTPPESPIIPPLQPSAEHNSNVISPVQRIDIVPIQRTLRQRNAVQQNPYTVDRAKYMLTLAGSGYKPIRDVDNFTRVRQDEESQESSFDNSSQVVNSFEPDSMDIEIPDAETLLELPSINLAEDAHSWLSMNEELPEIDILLNHHSPIHDADPKGTTSSTAYKAGSSFEKLRTPKKLGSQPRKLNYPANSAKKSLSREQQNSIPSPPRSVSTGSIELSASQENKSRDQSPTLLPTPLLSSGFRRKRPVIEDDTQSLSAHESVSAQSEGTESDDSERKEPGSEQLRVMQRKIKGVLPASWWSIDRLQRDLNSKRSRGNRTAFTSRPEIGVAQRKRNFSPDCDHDRPTRSAFLEDLASEESDDETQSRPENQHRQTSLPVWTPQPTPGSRLRDEEAVETMDEELIDPMLPRHSRNASSRRMQQSDLRDVVSRVKSGNKASKRIMHKHPMVEKVESRTNPKKLQRRRLDRDFDLLNAPDLQSTKHADLPDFLRIAARQARQRTRTSPSKRSNKSIRLPNPVNLESDHDDNVGARAPNTPSIDATAASSHAKRRSSFRSDVDDRTIVEFSGTHEGFAETVSTALPRKSRVVLHLQENETHRRRRQTFITEDHANEENARTLRLTRLKTLLPLTNRSSKGRLASSKSTLPRGAQFEEALPVSLALPRRIPRPATSKSAIPRDQACASAEISSPSPRLHVASGKRLPTRRKKRTPIKSSIVQQSLLVPNQPADRQLWSAFQSNDPNLQQLLHAEFSDYQTAWFQGRKLGQICANSATQHRFDIFIKVVTAHLAIAAQDSENGHDARELNSFIHRLLPNRREIGAQGQIGDKIFDVLEQDILVARNVFDLHICLLNLAPGCAPRPRVLEMMVNFTQAHHEICIIALSAWKAIYTCHHVDVSITKGLANWMYSILSQLIARWFAAESDARADADNATHRVAESLVRQVIKLNRSQACELLCQAHSVMETSTKAATSITEADTLLDINNFLKHLDIVSRQREIAEDVLQSALQVAKSYLDYWKKWHPATHTMAILGGIRQSVASLTSSRNELTRHVQKTLVEVFFTFARTTVEQHQKHWDDFFEPTSSFSLDIFVAQKYLQSMKTLFFHFFVEREKNQYFLDFRARILTHWLHVLLQQQEDNFAELLTSSLFQHENESLAMSKLASTFIGPNELMQIDLIQQSLPEIRYSTVTHVLSYLFEQEHYPEGDWLVGGLDNADAVSLLRTIFSTMKETWILLNEKPEEQDMYTILVHSALDVYELYPRSDFKIDAWFFNSATFPQRRKHTLAKLLQNCESSNATLEEAIEVFQQETLHAQRFDRFAQLEADLKEMLIPQPRDNLPIAIDVNKVWSVHAAFICEAFSPIITTTDTNLAQARSTVLNVLANILDNLECRLASFRLKAIRLFVAEMDVIVHAFAKTMHQWNDKDKSKAFIITNSIFEWSTTVLEMLSEQFVDDVESICDVAGEEYTEEAFMLLQTVVARR